jgi:hypothetical protein
MIIAEPSLEGEQRRSEPGGRGSDVRPVRFILKLTAG